MKPYPVYAVGGCVRDYLLNIIPKDYDFCTNASPEIIEKKIKESGKRAYLTGKRFGTIGCKINGEIIEITSFRSEEYTKGSRKPKVKYVKSISEDLYRRDFTINAMALRLTKKGLKLIDNHKGKEDLKNGIIKCVGTPRQRFKEDSLRMLRAVRFACRFNFKIEANTFKKMQERALTILDISKERWVMELDKILSCDNVELGLNLLWDSNLFRFMIPEMQSQRGFEQNSKYHNYTLDEHTIIVVKNIPKEDLNLRWAGLLHDIAKPFVQTHHPKGHCNYIGHGKLGADIVKRLARHLKFSNDRTDTIIELVENHLEENSILKPYDNIGKRK